MRLVGWEPHFSAECSLVRSDVAELYFLKWKAQSNAMQGQMWFCCWWEGGGGREKSIQLLKVFDLNSQSSIPPISLLAEPQSFHPSYHSPLKGFAQ